jgi:hypothetical protein
LFAIFTIFPQVGAMIFLNHFLPRPAADAMPVRRQVEQSRDVM